MWKYQLPVPYLTSCKHFKRTECRQLLEHLLHFAMHESTKRWDSFQSMPTETVPEFVCVFVSCLKPVFRILRRN
jgi:hypothetical protein